MQGENMAPKHTLILQVQHGRWLVQWMLYTTGPHLNDWLALF